MHRQNTPLTGGRAAGRSGPRLEAEPLGDHACAVEATEAGRRVLREPRGHAAAVPTLPLNVSVAVTSAAPRAEPRWERR